MWISHTWQVVYIDRQGYCMNWTILNGVEKVVVRSAGLWCHLQALHLSTLIADLHMILHQDAQPYDIGNFARGYGLAVRSACTDKVHQMTVNLSSSLKQTLVQCRGSRKLHHLPTGLYSRKDGQVRVFLCLNLMIAYKDVLDSVIA